MTDIYLHKSLIQEARDRDAQADKGGYCRACSTDTVSFSHEAIVREFGPSSCDRGAAHTHQPEQAYNTEHSA